VQALFSRNAWTDTNVYLESNSSRFLKGSSDTVLKVKGLSAYQNSIKY